MLLALLVSAGGLAALTADHRKTPFDAIFDKVGKAEAVGPDLLRAIARHESNFRAGAIGAPNRNGSKDYGLMQINDRTARAMGVDPASLVTSSASPDPAVVERSVALAARLIRSLWRELGPRANTYTVIAAYNAGSPAIKERGIFNTAYVMAVSFHHQLYSLGSLLRGNVA